MTEKLLSQGAVWHRYDIQKRRIRGVMKVGLHSMFSIFWTWSDPYYQHLGSSSTVMSQWLISLVYGMRVAISGEGGRIQLSGYKIVLSHDESIMSYREMKYLSKLYWSDSVTTRRFILWNMQYECLRAR
jgi:hypothetical protein